MGASRKWHLNTRLKHFILWIIHKTLFWNKSFLFFPVFYTRATLTGGEVLNLFTRRANISSGPCSPSPCVKKALFTQLIYIASQNGNFLHRILLRWVGKWPPTFIFNIDEKGCVKMKRSGSWIDSECSNRFAFICMKGGNLKIFVEFQEFGDWIQKILNRRKRRILIKTYMNCCSSFLHYCQFKLDR